MGENTDTKEELEGVLDKEKDAATSSSVKIISISNTDDNGGKEETTSRTSMKPMAPMAPMEPMTPMEPMAPIAHIEPAPKLQLADIVKEEAQTLGIVGLQSNMVSKKARLILTLPKVRSYFEIDGQELADPEFEEPARQVVREFLNNTRNDLVKTIDYVIKLYLGTYNGCKEGKANEVVNALYKKGVLEEQKFPFNGTTRYIQKNKEIYGKIKVFVRENYPSRRSRKKSPEPKEEYKEPKKEETLEGELKKEPLEEPKDEGPPEGELEKGEILEETKPAPEAEPETAEPIRISFYDFLYQRLPGHFRDLSPSNLRGRRRNLAKLIVDEEVIKDKEIIRDSRGRLNPAEWYIDKDDTAKQDWILTTINRHYLSDGSKRKKKEAKRPIYDVASPYGRTDPTADSLADKNARWVSISIPRPKTKVSRNIYSHEDDLAEKTEKAKKAKVPASVIGVTKSTMTLNSIADAYTTYSKRKKDLNMIFEYFGPEEHQWVSTILNSGNGMPTELPIFHKCITEKEKRIEYLLNFIW